MKEITPFQFFRYLIPGGISLLFFITLSLIKDNTELCPSHSNTNIDWLSFNLAQFQSVNGLGAGLLVIVCISIWGSFCNIIYQVLLRITRLHINHRDILIAMEANELIELKDWTNNHDKINAKNLSISGSWSVFSTEYYRLSNEFDRKPEDLLRHEALFDYLHGAGITIIGCLIGFIVWFKTTTLSEPPKNEVICYAWLFILFLLANYVILHHIGKLHVEGAFYRLFALKANLILEDEKNTEKKNGTFNSTSTAKQVIFVGSNHISVKKKIQIEYNNIIRLIRRIASRIKGNNHNDVSI